MKKLINLPESVVDEMLEGLIVLDPGLARLLHQDVLVRLDAREARDRQVALISGGGSGHEPAHAGYIGAGMLSAAVAGQVFTSPSADSVFAAIKAVAGKPGVLLIVKNYTGDRLNFGVAAEMARAEGIAVKMVVVADDVALQNKKETAGARGLAGTVLVHKIAGAAAAEGKSLEEVSAAAQAAADAMGTMGISLSAGTSPAVGKPSFTLGDQEIELGLGIHGEPGVRRMPLEPADALAETLIATILDARPLSPRGRVAVLVNNLGATTPMELAIIARYAFRSLAGRGITVERMYSGTLLSSLDMAGISISILPVDDDRVRWLDASTTAPGWPNAPKRRPTPCEDRMWMEPAAPAVALPGPPKTPQGKTTERAIQAACAALLAAEPRLTELDRIAGDGDLGTGMARGAKAIQEALPTYPLDRLPDTLKAIGHTLQAKLAGSSGPLYGVLLIRAANVLDPQRLYDLGRWADAVNQACTAIGEMGGAQAGDRTMLDALLPFAATLGRQAAAKKSAKEALEAAVEAAAEGAERTAQMLPRRGRSSYLGERVLGHPDPGAVAVSIWLKAIIDSITRQVSV